MRSDDFLPQENFQSCPDLAAADQKPPPFQAKKDAAYEMCKFAAAGDVVAVLSRMEEYGGLTHPNCSAPVTFRDGVACPTSWPPHFLRAGRPAARPARCLAGRLAGRHDAS